MNSAEVLVVDKMQEELGRKLTATEKMLVTRAFELGKEVKRRSVKINLKRTPVRIRPSMTIDRGDTITIEVSGAKHTGEVLTASYFDTDGWFIEMKINGVYRTWSQKNDGGTLISIKGAIKDDK